MRIKIDDNATHPVRIDATDAEAWTIVNGLEAAADSLTKAAHALNDEAAALPLLESAGSYQSIADRIRDDIE